MTHIIPFTFYDNSHVEEIWFCCCCCIVAHSNYAWRIQKSGICSCYWCYSQFICIIAERHVTWRFQNDFPIFTHFISLEGVFDSIRFACFCADMWARDFKGNFNFLTHHPVMRSTSFWTRFFTRHHLRLDKEKCVPELVTHKTVV